MLTLLRPCSMLSLDGDALRARPAANDGSGGRWVAAAEALLSPMANFWTRVACCNALDGPGSAVERVGGLAAQEQTGRVAALLPRCARAWSGLWRRPQRHGSGMLQLGGS